MREKNCASCLHFLDDPGEFERAFPGILTLSSGGGDTRGDQGICKIHEKMVTPNMTCEDHRTR